MSFLQRVAAIATITLSISGMVAPGSAVQAAELARAALVSPSVAPLNVPAADPVPSTSVQPADAKQIAAVDTSALPSSDADAKDDDTVVYPTLAAAVAAQSMPSDADEQLRCLAGAIYFESKGEPLAGQLAVAHVILNRATSGRFGTTPCAVVKQRGQFSFVRGGAIPAIDTGRAAYRTAMAIAKVAMADAWESTAGRALYFHARRVSPGWHRTQVAAIGNHVFYR